MTSHPTVGLEHPTLKYKALIDEKIAPLISLLWDAGINTLFCCQGDMSDASRAFDDEDADRAYIAFPDQESFRIFFEKISIANDCSEIELHSEISENYPSTLFDRIYRCPLNKWEFATHPRWEDGKLAVTASVYFPSHDINEMILVLKKEKYKAKLISVNKEPIITEPDQCTLVY